MSNNTKLISATIPIEPINGSTILSWARRTFYADRKTYQSKHRSLSCQRLYNLLVPNLDKPIFIIGSPRSGTTFLGSCIARLPEISYHYEPIATKAAARYVYQQRWSKFTAKWFYHSVYAWLMRIHFDGDLRFAEKTPRNCFLIPFLAETFPKARFIHIIRDGRDVTVSLNNKPWFKEEQKDSGKFEPGGYPYGPYSQFWVEPERELEFETTNDIHRCIWVWKRFTESAIAAIEQLPSDRYIELKYESLVFNFKEEAHRLLSFLEIDNPISQKIFKLAVNKVKSDSVAQWKKELSCSQIEETLNEAGTLLKKLGYL